MTVRATFTFRNQGGAAATGVRVRFNVPDGLVYLVGTGQLDGNELDDEHGNSPILSRAGADIGDVAPGQERRIDIAYSVAGAIENGSTVEIQAAVAAFELPPVGSNIVRLVARSRPSLENPLTSVAIESRAQEPHAGGEAAVTVRVHNAGESSAHDVVVVAPIPEHTSYVANSARVNGRELERDLLAPFDRVHAPIVSATLPASATVTLQYRVRIDDPLADGTTIVTRAQIASQETAAFAVDAAGLTVKARAEFEDDRTNFTIEPTQDVAPGSRVLLRVRAHNSGTTVAQNVSVILTLPEGLIPVRGAVRVDGRPLKESKDRKGSSGAFEIGGISAREEIEFVAEATIGSPIADATHLPVQATLRWDGGERHFERSIAVRSLPHLSARRNRFERVSGARLHPSDECEAVVTIANDGSAAATDAVLELKADAGLDEVRVFDKNTRLEFENGAVELGSVEPYTSRKLTVRARVRTPYPDRSDLRLSASLHTQELGETPLGEAVWCVDSHPAFSPEGSTLQLVQDDVFRPNQLVDVFVRLRNEGTDTAQNVRLRLFVSPEARLETVDGATRERSTLLFGEILPGATAEARLGVRLLRSLATSHPVTIDSVVSADAMLPVQLSKLTVVTTAEPNFSIGTMRSEPAEVAEAGEEVEFILYVRNSGDGPAQRVRLSVDATPTLIYVPNSTTVNDLPVRDVGAHSPLMSERGIVMSEVDSGVEATIRWREVVNNAAPSGETVLRRARIAYDGDRVDDIVAPELKIRCAPAFANTISGLPFGLDGMLGPAAADGGAHQRSLTGTEFVELPPATPVARNNEIARGGMLSLAPSTNGNGMLHEATITEAPARVDGIEVALAFDRERIDRTLKFLSEARFAGLVTHLFALRALFPDAIGGASESSVHEVRETLRETLDRLFIKLRLPNYVIASRDLETPAGRAALDALLGTAAAGRPAAVGSGSVVLRGSCDEEELRALRDRLTETALATALPWAVLARFVPADGDALRNYRELLIAALDELVSADERAFVDELQRRKYPVLDAALDVVRAQLGTVHA